MNYSGFVSLLVVIFVSQNSITQNGWGEPPRRQSCIDKSHTGRITAGVATAASASGGIYALKKYSLAKVFDKQNTKALVDLSGKPQALAGDRISMVTRDILDGDRVQVHYRLSEQANRAHHISELEADARNAQTLAHSYQAQAAAAMMPRTEIETYTENGQMKTRTVMKGPDFAAHAMYTSMAAREMQNAGRFKQEANTARKGGPVPWYEFDKTFNSQSGNKTAAANFLKENAQSQGSVVKVTRMPAAQFKQLRTIITRARGGAAIAVTAGALAVEELLVGKVSEKISGSSSAGRVKTLSRENFARR